MILTVISLMILTVIFAFAFDFHIQLLLTPSVVNLPASMPQLHRNTIFLDATPPQMPPTGVLNCNFVD